MLAAYLFVFLATFTGWVMYREVVIVFLGAMTGLIITIQAQIYIVTRHRQIAQIETLREAYRQIEAMFSVFSLLELRGPLPSMSGYAAYPDFAKVLIGTLYERKPKVVVEAGSGVSSVLIAYCLRALGTGTLVSLEHDKDYLDITQKNLEVHELQDIATIRYAPLREVRINNRAWMWYDPEQIVDLDRIDMLVIDGPPGETQSLARYPAIPMLFHALSDNAAILLDDGKREDEQRIVELWKQEFGCFEIQRLDTYKGAIILRKTKAVDANASNQVVT